LLKERAGFRHRSIPWFCAFLAGLLALAAPLYAQTKAVSSDANGLVVSASVEASQAGARILAAGGNAVDAAVATSFALAVTEPYHSGIGGGGFLLLRRADGEVIALDGREEAPEAAVREMFVIPGVPEDASRLGGLSVGVPGLVAMLVDALEAYGTLSLAEVMAPAIELAEQGVAIGPYHADVLTRWKVAGLAQRFPETARIQLPPDGASIRPGWRLVQTDLASTLRRIASEGKSAFYDGPIAEAIVAETRRQGGILSLEDIVGYCPKRRVPIRGTYRGFDVASFPPPSSGGVALVEMLNVLEGFDLSARGSGSLDTVHLVAEAMQLAFADRAAYLGDSDFVDVPASGLISKQYARTQRARIAPPWYRRAPWTWGRPPRAILVEHAGIPPSDGGTSHFSIADAQGNAVAVTQTINLHFGSGITVPGTGIVLNDEMDDFAKAPNAPNAFGLVDTRGANAIAPGKRPLSSMSPTILSREGQLFMITGSPGGSRIISTTLLTILNAVDFGMNAQEVVSAPRFHQQWVPDELLVEPETPTPLIDGLEARGHRVRISKQPWSSAQVILFDPVQGVFTGGSDPRSDGAAIGPSSIQP